MKPYRVALTGGIGSGKSTAGRMFAELGVPVLDLDEVGRSLTEVGNPGLEAVVKTFGTQVLRPDGTLNRRALAAMCFADEAMTQRLNQALHPMIWQKADEWAQRQQYPYVVLEVVALIESGAQDRVDAIVAVISDLPKRRDRVRRRGDALVDLFDAIVARQCTDQERRKWADFVIENNGSLDELRTSVLAVHERILTRLGQRRFLQPNASLFALFL